jgi:hypothetical protein
MNHYLKLLVAAALLVLLVTCVPAAHADTSQRVNTTTLTHVVHKAQTEIWLHNIRKAHGSRTTCTFADYKGTAPHAFGTVRSCITRIYRHSDYTGRLATIKVKILMVPRYQRVLYEDGSGWEDYPIQPQDKHRKRSVYMNVIWVHP